MAPWVLGDEAAAPGTGARRQTGAGGTEVSAVPGLRGSGELGGS